MIGVERNYYCRKRCEVGQLFTDTVGQFVRELCKERLYHLYLSQLILALGDFFSVTTLETVQALFLLEYSHVVRINFPTI
jgi:hypothetical protein